MGMNRDVPPGSRVVNDPNQDPVRPPLPVSAAEALAFSQTHEGMDTTAKYGINVADPGLLSGTPGAFALFQRWKKADTETKAAHDAYVAESQMAPGRGSTVLSGAPYGGTSVLGSKPSDLRKTVLA